MSDQPIRFTFTPEGVAALFLKKYFVNSADEKHQQELTKLFEYFAGVGYQSRDTEVEALRVALMEIAQSSVNAESNRAPFVTLSEIHKATLTALAAGRE